MKYTLRRLREKDAPLMLEWMHDAEVTANLERDFGSKTLEDARAFVALSNQADTPDLNMACVNENDEYMGTVSLKHIDRQNKNAEYAICFRRCAHGTGAAYAATMEILRMAFEKLMLEKVYLYHYSTNMRANRFYQKVGFELEGRQRNQAIHRGILCDVIWFGKTREAWIEDRTQR